MDGRYPLGRVSEGDKPVEFLLSFEMSGLALELIPGASLLNLPVPSMMGSPVIDSDAVGFVDRTM